MHQKVRKFSLYTRKTVLAVSLMYGFSPILYAETENVQKQKLQEIKVIGKKKVGRKDKDVTGLGKIVKTDEDVNKQQIINIRDLVRYEPGVSVVEQGRGGSSGFSIQGVDRNRVLVTVDGIPQIQSYIAQHTETVGGAMNEVEMENISAIEINKGGNAAELGSGALGGSVGYHTKDVDDILLEGKSWGISSKTVYSGRDRRKAQTVGIAGRHSGGLEGLFQYTYRQGHEAAVHKDAGLLPQTISRKGAYIDVYDLRFAPNQESDNLFRMEGCTRADCVRHKAKPTLQSKQLLPTRDISHRSSPYTGKEENQRRAMRGPQETLLAEDYTGSKRIKPNPMDYNNGSWLARLGYRPSTNHYFGTLAEHSRQKYHSRDMTYPAYYDVDYDVLEEGKTKEFQLPKKTDPYRKEFEKARNNFGVWENEAEEGFPELLWTRTRFLKEDHQKQRYGVLYRYQPQAENALWADLFTVSFDNQNIALNSTTVKANCAPYPKADAGCRATIEKPGSFYGEERVYYSEKHRLLNTLWQKKWQWAETKHNVQIGTGYDRFNSRFNRDYEETAVFSRFEHKGRDNKIMDGKSVDIYKNLGPVAHTWRRCTDWGDEGEGIVTCKREPIHGSSWYVSMRDNIAIDKYLDLSLAMRYNRYKFRTKDEAIRNKSYKNLSWNSGVVLKPANWVALSYRASNGFRVPGFQDLYGYIVPGADRTSTFRPIADLEPETSVNHEWGVVFKGDFGNLEVSTFKSSYRNMIAAAIVKPDLEKGKIAAQSNFNLQNADLEGINVRSSIDLNGAWEALPEGLAFNFAYNHIKAKKLFINNVEEYIWFADYPLETIQPSRYIFGLNYDAPSGKWGTAFNWTHSRAKDPQELIIKTTTAGFPSREQAANIGSTAPWTTLDVITYYTPSKNITVRAGIYNLFNYRYLLWENVRQSSINSVAPPSPGSDYKRYAAAGRNFTFSLEMKY